MHWWEITTDTGRSFAVKGASCFRNYCNSTGRSAAQEAEERLDPEERIASYFRGRKLEHQPVTLPYAWQRPVRPAQQ